MGPCIYCETHNTWLTLPDVPDHAVIGRKNSCRLVDDPTNLDTLSVVWSAIPLEKRLTTVVGL